MEYIAAIIGSIFGVSGLTGMLVVIFSYRKYKAEGDRVRVENEKTELEYLKKSFIELNEETKRQFNEFKETTRSEIEELTETNKILSHKIEVLNDKLSSLMQWVMNDDRKYRQWLEQRLHEFDPNMKFPDTIDPPDVFVDDQTWCDGHSNNQ